ncbi:transglutaminase family protein [Ferrovibrio sp.]|uniref:transglutaminase family protein n=1 Tax=Ferrovibrio sp. TaxID=1917215 RepID=UPI00311E829C
MLLVIRHRTRYLYSQPVTLGSHRLMLRPREGTGLRLLSFAATTAPASLVHWSEDVWSNAVATATPLWTADHFIIDSHARVETLAAPPPVLPAHARQYPFRYDDAEWAALGALAQPAYTDPEGRLRGWAQAFVAGHGTDTLALLGDLNAGIAGWIAYQSRDAHGTQTPLETLQRGWGSCRDLALLLAEAVRWLGFGARLVSGYVYEPGADHGDAGASPDPVGGSTHAWVDIFLPGAGWRAFDPTNRCPGGEKLVPVAVARNIIDLPPVRGDFTGPPAAYLGMDVGVSVTAPALQGQRQLGG